MRLLESMIKAARSGHRKLPNFGRRRPGNPEICHLTAGRRPRFPSLVGLLCSRGRRLARIMREA
jgi:hypothetical protein